MKKFHEIHIVPSNPYPIIISLIILAYIITLRIRFQNKFNLTLTASFLSTILITFSWWKNILHERRHIGHYSTKVVKGLKYGILLFIASEVLFFFSFFWAFLRSSLSPHIELGETWPPQNILPFNPIDIPLLNTILLLSSGVSVTWTHHSILHTNQKLRKILLTTTISLGIIFTLIQLFEYINAPYSLWDSSYGRTFFISTGFHGLHVIIGTIFLITCLTQIITPTYTNTSFLRFEIAAWYWHFVDVVWLFLYTLIYWWGYYFPSIKVQLISN